MTPSGERPLFADALWSTDPRTRSTRFKCYSALAQWGDLRSAPRPPSRALPSRRDLVYLADIADSTFTEHFKLGNRRDLAAALGVERDGVDRCVLEAKEFTLRPWLRGWNLEAKKDGLAPHVALEALVRVTCNWALAHPHLAAMHDLEPPPVLRRAAAVVVAEDSHEEFVVILADAVAMVIDEEGRTGVTALNSVRSRLAALSLGTTDLYRRSLELAAAIGNFMVLAEDSSGIDPQLIRMLELAIAELREPLGRDS